MRGQNTGGRQVDTPNKVTAIFKDAVHTIYEYIGVHAAFIVQAVAYPSLELTHPPPCSTYPSLLPNFGEKLFPEEESVNVCF